MLTARRANKKTAARIKGPRSPAELAHHQLSRLRPGYPPSQPMHLDRLRVLSVIVGWVGTLVAPVRGDIFTGRKLFRRQGQASVKSKPCSLNCAGRFGFASFGRPLLLPIDQDFEAASNHLWTLSRRAGRLLWLGLEFG